jgi:hypothetical protein
VCSRAQGWRPRRTRVVLWWPSPGRRRREMARLLPAGLVVTPTFGTAAQGLPSGRELDSVACAAVQVNDFRLARSFGIRPGGGTSDDGSRRQRWTDTSSRHPRQAPAATAFVGGVVSCLSDELRRRRDLRTRRAQVLPGRAIRWDVLDADTRAEPRCQGRQRTRGQDSLSRSFIGERFGLTGTRDVHFR